MKTIWLFLCRVFSYLYLRIGGYKLWSNIYRYIWESRFKNVKLQTFKDMASLVAVINGDRWRRDSWKALWDAVSSPQRVQQIFLGLEPQPVEDLDCDDFMAFTVNAIEQSLAAGLMGHDGIHDPCCLTIVWMTGWNTGGHNVVLLKYPQLIGGDLYAFMDYDGPSRQCASIAEVVTLVRDTYVGAGRWVGITWAVSKPDLTPLETHWG